MSKGASREPQEIRIDFAVLPETNCQGLFNQIHKIYKKHQKHNWAPDTFSGSLLATAEWFATEVCLLRVLVDTGLPVPLSLSKFQRGGILYVMALFRSVPNIR